MIIEVRCPKCEKKLCEGEGTIIVKCPRCKSLIMAETQIKKIYIKNT